jgi:hypothetical protein
LRYLHDDKKILHRDMKSQNVFLVPVKAVAVSSWKGGTGSAPRTAGWERFAFQRNDNILILHRAQGGWLYGCSPDQPSDHGLYGYFPEDSVQVIPGQNLRATVKLGDFGISKALDNTSELVSTVIGTPFYMSPELVNKTEYNCKSDIWAAGCLVHEMSMLQHAFDATNIGALIMKIERMDYKPVPAERGVWAAPLIEKMLQRRPEDRLMAADLLRLLQPHLEAHSLAGMATEEIPPLGEAAGRRNFLDWRGSAQEGAGEVTQKKKNFLDWRGGRASRNGGMGASDDFSRKASSEGVSSASSAVRPARLVIDDGVKSGGVALDGSRGGLVSRGGGVTLGGGEDGNDITSRDGGVKAADDQDSPDVHVSTPELELSATAEGGEQVSDSHRKYLADEAGVESRTSCRQGAEQSPKEEWKIPSELEMQVETKSFGYLQCPVGAVLPKEENGRDDLSNLAEIMGDVAVQSEGDESLGEEVRAYQKLCRMYAVGGEQYDSPVSANQGKPAEWPVGRANLENGADAKGNLCGNSEAHTSGGADLDDAPLQPRGEIGGKQDGTEEVYEEDFDDEDVVLTERVSDSNSTTASSGTALASLIIDLQGGRGGGAEAKSLRAGQDSGDDAAAEIPADAMYGDCASPALQKASSPVGESVDMFRPSGSESPIGEESLAGLARNDSLAFHESHASAAWESLVEECTAYNGPKHLGLEYDDEYSDDFEEDEDEDQDEEGSSSIAEHSVAGVQSAPSAPNSGVFHGSGSDKDDSSLSSPHLLVSNSVFLPISDDPTVGMAGTPDSTHSSKAVGTAHL